MSGYKPGYSETHSPFYDAGYAEACSGRKYPDPYKKWSAMYMRGWRDGLAARAIEREQVAHGRLCVA